MATSKVFDPSLIGAANPVSPIYSYDSYMTAVMAFMVLQTVAVFGRVYVRAWLLHSFGPDDWACVITCVRLHAHSKAIGDADNTLGLRWRFQCLSHCFMEDIRATSAERSPTR